MKKSEMLNVDDLFGDLARDLDVSLTTETGRTLSIIDFIEQEVDLGIKLTRNQLLVLKIIYNCPLEEEDFAVLDYWKASGKTTWTEPRENEPQIAVLESGRRCLNENTFISTDKGLLTLKELVSEHSFDSEGWSDLPYLLHVAQELPETQAQVKRFFRLGKEDTKRLVTRNGYSIEGTKEHRIKVINSQGLIQWKYIGDIKVGDKLCLRKGANLFPSKVWKIPEEYVPKVSHQDISIDYPTHLDKELGYLLGALVGDGSWTDTKAVSLTCSLEDSIHFKKIYQDLFPSRKISQVNKKGSNACRLSLNSVTYRLFLNNLGWASKDRYSKRTPLSIRKSSKAVVAAYLSGLFDTDGGIEKGNTISLSSACKGLIEETQLLLLNFGIISKVKTKQIGQRSYYILSLLGSKSNRIFYEQIGFKLPRKKIQLEKYIDSLSRECNIFNSIPYQLSHLQSLIQQIPSARGKHPNSHHGKGTKVTNYKSEVRQLLGNSIKTGSSHNPLSSQRLSKLVEWLKDNSHLVDGTLRDHFNSLDTLDYFYEEVKEIQDSNAVCYDLEVPKTSTYVANGFTSHNSGKSTIAALVAAYEFYFLSKLESPQKYFNVATSTPIDILCLATTASQAKQNIFLQIAQILRNSSYFISLVKSGKVFIGKEFISYEEKGIYIRSGNSKSGSQVGGTLKCFILDEVSRFQDVDGHSNALELWSNIGISAAPFGAAAKLIAISSAWYQEDAIEILYNRTDTDPHAVGFKLVSWDLNTTINKKNPIVASEYATNPGQAALEYEGIRPAAADAFFKENQINACFTSTSTIEAKRYITKTKDLDLADLVKLSIVNIERRPQTDTVLHIDPSIKGDAYGLAFGHSDFNDDGEQIVIIDGLLSWKANLGQEVSISDVGAAIRRINLSRPLSLVTADHYNSAETIERLRHHEGIKSKIVFFSNRQQIQMYMRLQTLMAENKLILPYNSEWTPILRKELQEIQFIDGKKIDHPKKKGASKDLADAVASVAWHLSERVVLDKPMPVNSSIIASKPYNYTQEQGNMTHREKALYKSGQRRDWFLKERSQSKFIKKPYGF